MLPMAGLTLGGHINPIRLAWWVVRNELRERLPWQELAGQLCPRRVHQGVQPVRVPPESARVPRVPVPPPGRAPVRRDVCPIHFRFGYPRLGWRDDISPGAEARLNCADVPVMASAFALQHGWRIRAPTAVALPAEPTIDDRAARKIIP